MNDFSQRPDIQRLIHLRRARQIASAIIKRSREAGVPDQYMRINKDRFAEVIDPSFHGKSEGIKSLADSIYGDPDFLLKRNFIAIDGGSIEDREFAGFAILFRIIAYDKIGKHWNCDELRHRFETINSTIEITRNDLAEELKSYDILFLSELDKKSFSPHFDVGSFFDEVLTNRVYASLPTIITFSNPMPSSSPTERDIENMAAKGEFDSGCGKRIAHLSLTPKTTESILRVRVCSK